MKKIICIGEALIDMICTDKGKALSDGDHFMKKAGGAPTNVAAAIAALGGDVDLLATVGADPFGKHLMDVMHSFGVSTRWVNRDPDHFTTFAFVSLMESGERDFFFNRGADGHLQKEIVAKIPLEEVGIVHFGSATAFLPGPLQEAYLELLRRAQLQGCFISFDPNYRHLLFPDNSRSFIEQSWHFLGNCDFFKVSDEEAMLLTGAFSVADAAKILRKKTTAVFAITLGKEGTLLGFADELIQVPSIPVKVTDTTGAGDAFVGAVLYQLSKLRREEQKLLTTENWNAIIRNGNKAGARTCEYLGAMEAFKHLSQDIFS